MQQPSQRTNTSRALQSGLMKRRGRKVNWLNTHRVAAVTTSQCATCEDFRKLFTEDVHGLHLLSFLLPADHENGEHCFVAGLDECGDGASVFREWAHPWAKRMIVRNAVQMISPHPGAARS